MVSKKKDFENCRNCYFTAVIDQNAITGVQSQVKKDSPDS